VFSGRYKALVVEGSGSGYLKTVCDYVHLNPVRAHLLRPEERLLSYPWSSFGWYLAAPDIVRAGCGWIGCLGNMASGGTPPRDDWNLPCFNDRRTVDQSHAQFAPNYAQVLVNQRNHPQIHRLLDR